MTTKISSDNIQTTTLETLGSGPTITNVQITDSSYNVIDDTAVSTSGGYLKITGTNFSSGCTVIIGGTNATSTAFVNSTMLNVEVPAAAAGTYIVYVVNTDGGVAIRVNGLTYSGTPTWVTDSTLSGGTVDSAISIQLSATSDSTITYTLQNGSSLPSGLSLSSSGLLSGTITGLSSETTYNFNIVATDIELQDSPRSFSITITTGDAYWNYTTTLLSPTLSALPFNDDASANNFAVTINGDTKPFNFNPYSLGYYSNYFDGTGDYLTVPANAALTLGTSDYTVEAWVYLTGTQTTTYGWGVIGTYPGAGTGWSITINRSTGSQGIAWILGSSIVASYTTAYIPTNTWTHIAVTRSGSGSNNTRMFLNGALVTQVTDNTNDTFSGLTYIGGQGTGQLITGYISNARVVKGTAVYTSAFTPSTTPLTAIANTSLLTCQSSRFIDNSTNNFTLTVAGDTSIKSFTPYIPNSSYSTYGSTYFDGTGDYLTVPFSSAFNTGTTYTVEAWVYPTVRNTYNMIFTVSNNNVANFGGWLLWFNASGTVYFECRPGTGGTNVQVIGGTVPLTQWTHIAVSVNSNAVKLFVNGVQVQTGTVVALDGTQTNVGIGALTNGATASPFTGYLTDVRLVKGTAVYTSAFTPPTTPLTAISGTSLLTCQSNQPVNNNVFLDNSTNNFAITRNGNTTQGTFSPYGANWSNYFDGTGDMLTVPYNAGFSLTGDFTIELFVNYSAHGAYGGLICNATGGAGWSGWQILFNNANDTLLVEGNNSTLITSSSALPRNQWNHVALVRNGSSITLYFNGQSVGTATSSATFNSSTAVTRIGAERDGLIFVTGYISNARIVKGTALYTSNFTPSTTPLQAVSGTSLLTCQSPSIVDNSPSNLAITKNGDVSVQKFGPFAGTTLPTPYYSAYFDGTGDYLSLSTIQNFGTADFTVEAWVYLTAVNTNGIYASTGSTGKSRLYTHITNTSKLQATLRNSDGTNEIDYTGSTTINLNTWYHVAIVRYNNTLYLYVNGVSDMTPTPVTQNLSTNDSFSTVGSANATRLFNGYMSNLRVVAGTAVYTANFTPPTSPLTAITNTSLLTCQSSTLVDNSINNVTITVNGDTKLRTFNPFTVTYSIKQSYTPGVYGGSMYFDGTGDYLTVPASTLNQLGDSRYTMEFWMYPTVVNGVERDLINKNGATTYGYTFRMTTANKMGYFTDGTGNSILSTTTLSPNTWYHVAATFDGTTTRLFINGVQEASTTSWSSVTNDTGVLYIGARQYDASMNYAGYITDARIVKGSALYTSNFVPENRPLTSVRNSTLLLNGTSGGIYDSSTNTVFETRSPAIVSTSVVKYGNTSMYFSGASESGLYSYNNPGVRFGTGNFTVELWLYLDASLTGLESIITLANPSATTAARLQQNSGNTIYWIDGANLPGFGTGANIPMSVGTWTHIAICRSGTTTRYFKDGVQVASGTDTSSYNTDTLTVASNYDGSYRTNCYISDLRITKGVARYTANFTAPTSAFNAK